MTENYDYSSLSTKIVTCFYKIKLVGIYIK